MADVLLSVGVKTGTLSDSIQKEVKAALGGGKELKLNIVASKQKLIDSIKSVGGSKGVQAQITANKTTLTNSLKAILSSYTYSKGIKVDVDASYLRKQIDAALKGAGKGNFDSPSTKTGDNKSSTASSEKEVNAVLREQAALAQTTARAYNELNKVRNSKKNIAKGSDEYRGLEAQEEILRETISTYGESTDKLQEYKTQLADTTKENARLVDSAKESDAYANSFSQRLQRFKMHLTTITSIVRAFQMLRMVVQPVVDAVTEVDTALTQLRIVTQENDTAITSYANNIMKVADQTAGSVKDLINSTTTFSRLGYSLEESTDLAKYTQMLENVGDIDESSATAAITAIVKAYGIGTDELESVMDKLVEVGNNFPISVAEIAEGMNNAGSMLSVATGGNLDQSIAMLTAANTTIQNISKSSTGLRTIAARIRNVGTELDELGESMTEVEYDSIVKALTDNNVALTDSNGELRNTYDILLDLSQVWKTLSENEQAALAKTLSGTRQQNVFTSLMTNFGEATGAMDRMASSEGALSKANDVYLNSVQAHIQQLKNAFTEFSQSTISANAIKDVVELAKSLLSLASALMKISNFIGGIKTLLPLAITLFTIMRGSNIAKGIDSTIQKFKNFGALLKNSFSSGVNGAKTFSQALQGVEAQAVSTGAAVNAALGVVGLIITAVMLVYSVIDNLVSAERASMQAISDTGREAGETAGNLTKLYSAYSEAVNSSGDVAAAQSELEEALRKSGAAFDSASANAVNYGEELRKLTLEQLEYSVTAEKRGIEAQKNLLTGVKGEYSGLLLGFAKDWLSDFDNLMWNAGDSGEWLTEFLGLKSLDIDYVAANLDKIQSKLLEIKNSSEYGPDSKEYQRAYKFVSSATDALEDYAQSINKFNDNLAYTEFLKLGGQIPKTTSEFRKFRDELINNIASNSEFASGVDDILTKVDMATDLVDSFISTSGGMEELAAATSTTAAGFKGITDVVKGTSAAVSELDEILKGDDYGTGFEKRIGYYDKLLEEVENDNWGGKHYKGLADYFEIDTSKSVDEQIEKIQQLGRYFSDADEGMYNFLTDVNKLASAYASFDEESGFLSWDSSKLQEFADAMNISRDALIDLLGAYQEHIPPSEWLDLPADELAGWLEQDHAIMNLKDSLDEANNTLVLNRSLLEDSAEAAGYNTDELINNIRELDEYSGIKVISLDVTGLESAQEAADNIRAFLYSIDAQALTADQQLQAIAGTLSNLDAETVKEILIELNLPEDTTSKLLSYLPEDISSQINIDSDEADSAVQKTIGEVESLQEVINVTNANGTITISVTDNGAIGYYRSQINLLSNQLRVLGQNVEIKQQHATGTKHARPGLSLLGDEYSASGKPKPELVVSGNGAYLAGINGPVLGMLNSGDIVYTYKQTRQILGNNLDAIDGIPAFSSGKATKYWNRLSGKASSLSSSSTYSNYYGTSSGSGSSGSSASSSGSGDNWFEQQYELHNHYRKLDQETDANYLTWLVSAWRQAYAEGIIELKDAHKYEEEAYELMKKIASERFKEEYDTHQHMVNLGQETDQEYYSWLEWRYKTAYANNEITLEEYWKYEEEVYKKSKDLVSDYFNDIDKKIDMLENAGKSDIEIIAWDVKGMEYAEKQIAELRKRGKDNNDSDVQEQQKNWWGYYNDRKKREEEIVKNAKDAEKDLVDYRVKMLKKDLDNEKDALNDRLSAIRDFYSEQKDLLQESRDEEKYLDEQAEKRKKVSDLELQLDQLRVDNSAWAQKKRLQLEQELFDARKELNEFERDHALDVTQNKLDEMQEMQEKAIEKEIENVEKASTSEADLYKQALEDVRNGGQDLYEAMVEFNNTEGSGNPADISEMWDGAYTSLKKYKDLYGEYYDDINLRYGTDITPAIVDTSKIDAGYNPVEPKLAPQAPKKSTPAAAPVQQKAAAPAAKADPVTGTAVRLKSGAKLAYTSYDTPNLTPASWVFGRTLYVQAAYPGRNAPYHIGTTPNGYNNSATWVGFVNKAQLEGYASGTKSALAGIHEINERGDEALFKTADGSTYRLFSGGERVFNHEATGFLYDFANAPQRVLSQLLAGIGTGADIKNNTVSQNINMGDIIIQGGADQKTVSEIRREQRAQVDYMLKEFNRLNK